MSVGWVPALNLEPEELESGSGNFKMDTLKNAIALITKNCFFASVDLKNAYKYVSTAPKFRNISDQLFMGKSMNFWQYLNGFVIPPGFLQNC